MGPIMAANLGRGGARNRVCVGVSCAGGGKMTPTESEFANDKHDLSVPGADYVPGYWTIAPLMPAAKEPGRSVKMPLPTLPALLIIPFVAGMVVLLWLIIASGWKLVLVFT
jgi:hypothetical protein